MNAGMRQKGTTTKGIFAVSSLLLMAYLDHITGNEVVFSAAYLVPVAICGWHLSRTSVLLMSVAGGVVTWVVDWVGGHSYSHFLIHYWNSFACTLISGIVGLVLHRLRRILADRESKNEELRRALEALERSTEEVRKLQSGLQVVCAWTQRIQVGDEWMTPDEFLTKRLNLKLTHGISPEGIRKFEEGIVIQQN